jgi:hypothetical protein
MKQRRREGLSVTKKMDTKEKANWSIIPAFAWRNPEKPWNLRIVGAPAKVCTWHLHPSEKRLSCNVTSNCLELLNETVMQFVPCVLHSLSILRCLSGKYVCSILRGGWIGKILNIGLLFIPFSGQNLHLRNTLSSTVCFSFNVTSEIVRPHKITGQIYLYGCKWTFFKH